MGNEINNLYEFADFKFDGKRGKLWKNEELILLSPKATELLALLLEREGKFVDKEEIFEKVWAGTFVEDGVLTQNIYTLRKVLGNDAIENRTRMGYRITVAIVCDAEMGRHGDAENQTVIENNNLNPQIPASPRPRFSASVFAAFAIVLLLGGAFTFLYFRPKIAAFFRQPIETVKFTKLSNTGDLANAVLSPDGNLVAFIRGNNVFLKDIATQKDIKLEIPNIDSFSSPRFSPDGNFIYFRNNKIPNTLAKILKVSRFGGETTQIAENTWGDV